MTLLDSLLTVTQDLMRFRSTVTRPDQLNLCADYIARFFANTSLVVERFEHNGIPSLVITKGTKTPKIFLNGHFDVVEGDDDQFEPKIDGKKLYGRGALDMKSGDAVLMTLMKELADRPHDVGLMLVGDEEVGGFNGTGQLVQKGYLSQAVIIPDGGLAIHKIVEKEKGVLWINLRASGVPAHGSTPWKGESAISKLQTALQTIEKLFTPLTLHPHDHWVSTLNVGKIEGGEATNRIPAHAWASCDIRYTEVDQPDELYKKILSSMPAGVEVEKKACEPMLRVPMHHPLVIAFQEAVRAEGREPEMALDHGSSDGRFFSEKGIPVIISQPDGANLHAQNEWVDIPSIELYYKTIRRYLDAVAL